MATATAESRLRHRLEMPVFILSVLLNAAIMVGAIYVTTRKPEWLEDHPLIAETAKKFRAPVIGAILLAPGIVLLRNTRRAIMRGNSVRATPSQFAPIYDALRTQCRQLGMAVPALYVTDSAITEPARAYSAWDQDYIVLNTKYLPAKFEEMMDVIEFLLGSELGRIRLGHTAWWDELLLAYIDRLPVLRNPLSHVRTFSRDRYGAFLAPHALRGLVVVAAGRRLLAKVDIPEYIEQTKGEHGSWFWLSEITRKLPNTSARIRALHEFGFQFDEGTHQSKSHGRDERDAA